MLSNYYSGLNEEEKKEAKADYVSAHLFRKRLIELLQKQVDIEFEAMLNEEKFDPSHQIERLAKIKATKKIMKLVK